MYITNTSAGTHVCSCVGSQYRRRSISAGDNERPLFLLIAANQRAPVHQQRSWFFNFTIRRPNVPLTRCFPNFFDSRHPFRSKVFFRASFPKSWLMIGKILDQIVFRDGAATLYRHRGAPGRPCTNIAVHQGAAAHTLGTAALTHTRVSTM
jgi:hypothetical protein